MGSSDVELDCNPLYKNGSLLLNPCGLIANSFFTGMCPRVSISSFLPPRTRRAGVSYRPIIKAE